MLGVRPLAGRTFLPEEQDDAQAAHPVAVISERLWHGMFQSDPRLIGKTVRINRHQMTIAGMVPDRFRGTVPGLCSRRCVPVTMGRELGLLDKDSFTGRGDRRYGVLSRLRPGVTTAQAAAEASAFAATLSKTYPRTNGKTEQATVRLHLAPARRRH